MLGVRGRRIARTRRMTIHANAILTAQCLDLLQRGTNANKCGIEVGQIFAKYRFRVARGID